MYDIEGVNCYKQISSWINKKTYPSCFSYHRSYCSKINNHQSQLTNHEIYNINIIIITSYFVGVSKYSYLCSRMNFSRWMDINITTDGCSLWAIPTCQKMWWCGTILSQVETGAFQRHPAKEINPLITSNLDIWNGNGRMSTSYVIRLPWCFNLFPEIHGFIGI